MPPRVMPLPPGARMRRDRFLRCCLALPAAAWLLPAQAAATVRMWIPVGPGGGWDATGRALGQAMQDAGVVSAVQYTNRGGAAGALGLAQFLGAARNDPDALLVMGAVMVGGLIANQSPLRLSDATPLARLHAEYPVFVVPADSPLHTPQDLLDAMRRDPAQVRWGGGSRASTEHIAALRMAMAAGVDPAQVRYTAFRGASEAERALRQGDVTIAGDSYGELAPYLAAGRVRALGVTSPERFADVDVPTFREQGVPLDVGNWRGIYGAPGLSPQAQRAWADAIVQATQQPSWLDAQRRNGWAPAVLTGNAFRQFVEAETAAMRDFLTRARVVGTAS